MKLEAKTDFSGYEKKAAESRFYSRALHYQAEKWAAYTVRYIQLMVKSTGGIFKRTPKELNNNLAYRITKSSPMLAKITLGTGSYVGKRPVVYARIQDKGGWIKAKKAKYLTVPLPGVKGIVANYPEGFFFKSKKNNLLFGRTVGKRKKLEALFVLKKQVYLPGRFWFTSPINRLKPKLRSMTTAEAVQERARQMAR